MRRATIHDQFHDRRKKFARPGYGLVEMIVASLLASLLGILLALACAAFARPALEVEARARIAQEATLIAQSLACDLGGYMADPAGRLGDPTQYQFFQWNLSYPGSLLIFNQGSSEGNYLSVVYQLSGNTLTRYDTGTGITNTIAKYVTSFSVEANPENSAQLIIQYTVAFRYFSAAYTLISVSPPS